MTPEELAFVKALLEAFGLEVQIDAFNRDPKGVHCIELFDTDSDEHIEFWFKDAEFVFPYDKLPQRRTNT
jgi:hypothetical protein